MMPTVNVYPIKAFRAVCRHYRVPPLFALETFTGALSVEAYLFAGDGLPFFASRVFTLFTYSVLPEALLHPVKRERGIRYLRQMIRAERLGATREEKSRRHQSLMNAWLCLNGLHCAEKNLALSPALKLLLTEYYLLLCDLFLCPPRMPLRFFMQLAANSTGRGLTDCPAVQVLLYCAEAIEAITMN